MWYCFICPQVELMQLAKSEAICEAETVSQDHPRSLSTGKSSSAPSHISEIPGFDDFVLPNHCSPGAHLVTQHLSPFLLQLSSAMQSGTARTWYTWLNILMALTTATLQCAWHNISCSPRTDISPWLGARRRGFFSHQKTNTHSTIEKQICVSLSHIQRLCTQWLWKPFGIPRFSTRKSNRDKDAQSWNKITECPSDLTN